MGALLTVKRVLGAAILGGALLAQAAPVLADGPVAGVKEKVVFQVSEGNPKNWNLVLNNVQNVQDALGKDNVDVEVVVYGPGIGLLKFDSSLNERIGDALDNGVKVVACENTMKAQHLTKDDMLPKIGYVPGGVIELMHKQQQGYAYIRP